MDCVRVSYSKKEAKAILRRNKKHPKQYRKEKRMYYCQHCNAWHLTASAHVDADFYQVPIYLRYFKKWQILFNYGIDEKYRYRDEDSAERL